MSADTESAPAEPPAPASRRRGGFVGRFLAALLIIIITTGLALAAVALAAWNLGFSPATPAQLGELRAQFGTAEAQNAALRLQNSVMQTQVAELSRRGADDRETLSELSGRIDDLGELRQEIRSQIDASASQNATLVAEARSSRDAVALFATAEADRAALLRDLELRSERIERFLLRLSDIAGDAALDMGAATETSALVSPGPPSPTAATLPTETPTEAPTASPTAILPTGTPTEVPSSTPTPRSNATARPTGTPTPLPTNTATAQPTATP